MKKNPFAAGGRSASHTPLFAAVRRAARLAQRANRQGAPPVDELVELHNIKRTEADASRRRFIKIAATAPLLLSAGGFLEACKSTPTSLNPTTKTGPRIVIVGGGIAGLNAAYQLKKKGYTASIYDANTRTGGRIYTAQNIMANGLFTELGGEFIDSDHTDMLNLVQEFGLTTLDTRDTDESTNYIRHSYFFGGKFYSEADVVTAFQPFTARLAADVATIDNGDSSALDNTSVKQYISSLGITGWLSDMLNVAYLTEYGLDTDQQSAYNFLGLIPTDVSNGTFDPFGTSDERYHVVGGNQKIVDALAAQVASQINLGYQLEAVRPKGTGFTLSFLSGGAVVDVVADYVIMTIPFTMLRNVDLSTLGLPADKLNAIDNLGYGTNVKLMFGVNSRVWRNQKLSGYIFSDEKYQNGWDNSWLQLGTAGGFTIYLGGSSAVTIGGGAASGQLMQLIPGLEKAFPGVTAAQNGNAQIFNWPAFNWTRGSYTCWKPGQATTMGADVNSANFGNMYFAGEHCSDLSQGYMNGGAETGNAAAQAIITLLA